MQLAQVIADTADTVWKVTAFTFVVVALVSIVSAFVRGGRW